MKYAVVCFLFMTMLIMPNTNITNADKSKISFSEYPVENGTIGRIIFHDSAEITDAAQTNITINGACYENLEIEMTSPMNDGYYYSPSIQFELVTQCDSVLTDFTYSGSIPILKIIDNVPDEMNVTIGDESFSLGIPFFPSNIKWAFSKPYVWGTCSDMGFTDDENYSDIKKGDGICDQWEKGTHLTVYFDNNLTEQYDNGTCDLDCMIERDDVYVYECESGCTPQNSDVFVELDSFAGFVIDNDAIIKLKNAIEASSELYANKITVHVDLDETIIDGHELDAHIEWSDNQPEEVGYFGFDQIKSYWFGTPDEKMNLAWDTTHWALKSRVFHYGLAASNISDYLGSSGIADPKGSDFTVAMGFMGNNSLNDDFQSAILMHELGHNFGLHHGGADLDNCKPNYISIMNYPRQFAILVPDRALDYSHEVLPTLDEQSLQESTGTGIYTNRDGFYEDVLFGPIDVMNPLYEPDMFVTDGQWIDWNKDEKEETDEDISVENLELQSVPINQNLASVIDCIQNDNTTIYDSLEGHNDWDSLHFDVWSKPLEMPETGAGVSLTQTNIPFYNDNSFNKFPHEINYDDVKELNESVLAGLQNAIMTLNRTDFKSLPNVNNDKLFYLNSINDVVLEIRNGNFLQAQSILQEKIIPTLDDDETNNKIKQQAIKDNGIYARAQHADAALNNTKSQEQISDEKLPSFWMYVLLLVIIGLIIIILLLTSKISKNRRG